MLPRVVHMFVDVEILDQLKLLNKCKISIK